MQSVALILTLVAAARTPKPWAIEGTITAERDDRPLADALVVLQCTCLLGTREVVTDARGRYRFGGLPPGTYVVQVLRGTANVSKVLTLGL